MRVLTDAEIAQIIQIVDPDDAQMDYGLLKDTIRLEGDFLTFVVTSGDKGARAARMSLDRAGLNIQYDDNLDTNENFHRGAEGADRQKCYFKIDLDAPLFREDPIVA